MKQTIDNKKTEIIQKCIRIAETASSISAYKKEVTDYMRNNTQYFSRFELCLLYDIIGFKHIDMFHRNLKNESLIQDRLQQMRQYYNNGKRQKKSIINESLELLYHQVINSFVIKRSVGRPVGKGKKQFSYNDKIYNTIQQCADDYNITKQGMYKRLKKLGIL